MSGDQVESVTRLNANQKRAFREKLNDFFNVLVQSIFAYAAPGSVYEKQKLKLGAQTLISCNERRKKFLAVK